MTKQQILAIGGGGFGQSSPLHLERYLLSMVDIDSARVCFLPQASREDANYVVRFFEAFTALGAQPTWVSLFGRVTADWRDKILGADIVYVGGGNTKSMIALWQAWGVDQVLREAYQQGVVMSGVSAGGICWFEQGVTDSVWPLGVVDGLGFLPGSFCPHYDAEPERPGAYQTLLNEQKIKPGIALADDTAVHYINGQLHQAITASPKKQVLQISAKQKTPIQLTTC